MKYLAQSNGFYAYGTTIAEAEKNLRSNGGDITVSTVHAVPSDHQLVKPNPINNTKTPLTGNVHAQALVAVQRPGH